MDFPTSIKTCFSKYVDFSGRASRSEFWYFHLFCFLASFMIAIVDATSAGVFGTIFSLFVMLPALAVGARRLHDIDKSGWWQLISLIPIVGFIILIVWFCQKSDPNTNRFDY